MTATKIWAVRAGEQCSLVRISGDIYRLDGGSFDGRQVRESGDVAILLAEDGQDWIGNDGFGLMWKIIVE